MCYPVRDVKYHMYADDTQLYKAAAPSLIYSTSHDVERCCASIGHRMQSHKLKLNENKTEIRVCYFLEPIDTQQFIKSILEFLKR